MNKAEGDRIYGQDSPVLICYIARTIVPQCMLDWTLVKNLCPSWLIQKIGRTPEWRLRPECMPKQILPAGSLPATPAPTTRTIPTTWATKTRTTITKPRTAKPRTTKTRVAKIREGEGERKRGKANRRNTKRRNDNRRDNRRNTRRSNRQRQWVGGDGCCNRSVKQRQLSRSVSRAVGGNSGDCRRKSGEDAVQEAQVKGDVLAKGRGLQLGTDSCVGEPRQESLFGREQL